MSQKCLGQMISEHTKISLTSKVSYSMDPSIKSRGHENLKSFQWKPTTPVSGMKKLGNLGPNGMESIGMVVVLSGPYNPALVICEIAKFFSF